LFLRDPNTRRRLLHPCTLQTAQEGDEGLDVVRGEYTTDRKSPQPRGMDLNGFRGVAIDFRRHLLERSVLEGDLTSQPGRGALRIDLQRDSGPVAGLHLELLIRAQLERSRLRCLCRPRSDSDPSFEHGDLGGLALRTYVELSRHVANFGALGQNPEWPLRIVPDLELGLSRLKR